MNISLFFLFKFCEILSFFFVGKVHFDTYLIAIDGFGEGVVKAKVSHKQYHLQSEMW